MVVKNNNDADDDIKSYYNAYYLPDIFISPLPILIPLILTTT